MYSVLGRLSLVSLCALGLATAACETHKGDANKEKLAAKPVNLGEAADELKGEPGKPTPKKAPKPPDDKPTPEVEDDAPTPTGPSDKTKAETTSDEAPPETDEAPPPPEVKKPPVIKDKKARLKAALADGEIQCSEVIAHVIAVQNQPQLANEEFVAQLIGMCQMNNWSPEARKCILGADQPEDIQQCEGLVAASKPKELPGPDCTRVVANVMAARQKSPHIPPAEKARFASQKDQAIAQLTELCKYNWKAELRTCMLRAPDFRHVVDCQSKETGG